MSPHAIVGPPAVGGGFSLVDHHGRNVDDKAYRGSYVLIIFGFTRCKVVCPRNLAKLSAVLDRLGPLAERIRGLYITVDPERDSPEVMRAFLDGQSCTRFVGLTGSAESIQHVLVGFRVFARRRDQEDGGYQMPHSAFTYVLDPEGRFVEHWPATMKADEMVLRLRQLLVD
jgi:protein SCO1